MYTEYIIKETNTIINTFREDELDCFLNKRYNKSFFLQYNKNIIVSFNSKKELIKYYEENLNEIKEFRLGKMDNNGVCWGDWKEAKHYPYEVFIKYAMEILK